MAPAPVAVAGRRFTLTAVVIVLNEARYIAEWIEYHGLIGFEHFYIFDNGSTDDLAAVLRPYIVQGRATLIAWPIRPGQQAAYNFALSSFGRDSEWMALFDIDEFFSLAPGWDNLPAILNTLGEADQMLVSWMVFGSSGHETRPAELVTKAYVHRAERPAGEVKAIVRPEAVVTADVHHCRTRSGRTVDGDGRPVAERWRLPSGAAGRVRLNHYFTKSRAEFAEKIARGQAGNGTGKTMAAFTRFDCPVPDESLAAFAPAIRAALARTAARPAMPIGFAPFSSLSELNPCRPWALAVSRALDEAAAGLPGATTIERRYEVEHPQMRLEADIPPDAADAAFAQAAARIAASLPGGHLADEASQMPPFGRVYLLWQAPAGLAADCALTMTGRDAAGREYRWTTTLPAGDGFRMGAIMLAPRTLTPERIAVAGAPLARMALGSFV